MLSLLFSPSRVKRGRTRRAFTLLEVLVGMVVLAIVSSLGTVAVSRYVNYAHDQAALTEVSRVGKDTPRRDANGLRNGVDMDDVAESVSQLRESSSQGRTLAPQGLASLTPTVFSAAVTSENAPSQRLVLVAKRSGSGACAAGVFNPDGNPLWLDLLPTGAECRADVVPAYLTSTGSTVPFNNAPAADADAAENADSPQEDAVPASPSVSTRPQGTFGTWDHAVFSHSELSLTNMVTLLDGSAYTTEGFSCDSQSAVAGAVVASGSATLTNNCSVRNLWTGDGVVTSSTPRVDGDVWTVGDLRAGNSSLSLGGDVYATGNLLSSDGRDISVGGTLVEGASVDMAPLLPMPYVYGHSSFWSSRGFAEQPWGVFADGVARSNSAPSWVDFVRSPCTQVSSASWSVNGPVTFPNVPTVLDARSAGNRPCQLTFTGPNTLLLNADVTILVDSFTTSGRLDVRSADGGSHTLRIVSPWPDDAVSCSDVNTGRSNSVSFAGANASVDPLVPLLLYSPGRVSLSNDVTASGQVYGCDVKLSNNVTWTFASAAP